MKGGVVKGLSCKWGRDRQRSLFWRTGRDTTIQLPGNSQAWLQQYKRGCTIPQYSPTRCKPRRRRTETVSGNPSGVHQRESTAGTARRSWSSTSNPVGQDREGTVQRGNTRKGEELTQWREVVCAVQLDRQGILVLPYSQPGTVTKVNRVLVPTTLRESAFHSIHSHQSAGHFGVWASAERPNRYIYYPGLKRNIQRTGSITSRTVFINLGEAAFLSRSYL